MKGKQNQELKVMKELPFEVMKRIGSFLEDIDCNHCSPHSEAKTKIAFSQTCRAFYDPNIPKRKDAIDHLEDLHSAAVWLEGDIQFNDSDYDDFLHLGHIVYNQYLKDDKFLNIGLTAKYADYVIRGLTKGVENMPSRKAPQWLQQFVTEKGLIFMDQHPELVYETDEEEPDEDDDGHPYPDFDPLVQFMP